MSTRAVLLEGSLKVKFSEQVSDPPQNKTRYAWVLNRFERGEGEMAALETLKRTMYA